MPSRFTQRYEYSNRSNADIPNDRRQAPNNSVPNDVPNSFNTENFGSGSSNKILPILIMLDVSPSMHDEGRIDEQNQALETFLKAIARIDKVRKVARVSFCLFTRGVKYRTDFMPLNDLRFVPCDYLTGTHDVAIKYRENQKEKDYVMHLPRFTALKDDGTDVPKAVEAALDHMQSYLRKISGQQHYVPFLVFTSDGNPDLSMYKDHERADYLHRTQMTARRMNSVCNRNCDIKSMIIPFFIGIGNADENYLRSFCREFQEGVQLARKKGMQLVQNEYQTFADTFEQIAMAIANSITLNQPAGKLLEDLTKTIRILKNVRD